MNKNSVKTMKENVINIEKINNKYNIITENMRELTCEYLILATGTRPGRDAELLSGISEGIKERIIYEPYTLFGESEKEICIIGGSDAAFDYAMSLSKRNRISVFVRGEKSRAVKRLVELVRKNKKIKVFYSTKITSIDNFGRGLSVRTESESEEIWNTFDFVVFAIGREAEYPEIKDFENIKEEKNLFLVGDIKNGIYRQLSLSVADGMRAAMGIDFKIRRIESESN
jgi:thioredoxin reductase